MTSLGWAIAGLGAFGSAIVAIGLQAVRREHRFRARARPATAEIVRHRDWGGWHLRVYRFTTEDGRSVEAEGTQATLIESHRPMVATRRRAELAAEIGQMVALLYDPLDPTHIALRTDPTEGAGTVVLGLIVIGTAVLLGVATLG